MDFNLIELTDRERILQVYGIYRHCMYMPTQEKFSRKVNAYLGDGSVKVFACLYCGEIRGVIAVSFTEPRKAEILGIATDPALRGRGIGSYMIKQLIEEYGLAFIYAETDDDAVGFYRKNRFAVRAFSEDYDGQTVVRYQCGWTGR